MTSKKFCLVGFLAVLVAWFACPSLFGYEIPIKSDNIAVTDSSSTSDASRYCAFLLLKKSLEKNNISYDFNTNGLYKDITGYQDNVGFTINGVLLNLQGYNNPSVVLWARSPLDAASVDFDYSITLTAHGVRAVGDNSSIKTYIYYDYGVCRLTNWIGSRLHANNVYDFANKNIELVSNVSNSMPILFSDKGVDYFTNPKRIYNLTQQSPSTSTRANLSNMLLGSMYDLQSQSENLLYWTGSTNSYFQALDCYSLQTSALMNQDQLPWQLQFFNAFYNPNDHDGKIPAALTTTDTDEGTEPDWSEYYNAHDFEDPDDDWGQPADIGGGSGSGGEVTSFGPSAQSSMTQSGTDALENYFGSDSTVTTPQLETTDYEEDLDDIATDDDFLTSAKDEIEDDLLDVAPGIPKLQRIINALKTPGSGRLPVWDLSLESNVLPNMSVFHGAQAQVDLNVLLQPPYKNCMVILRKVVVFLMFGNLVIYIITDFFGIGRAGSAE